MAGPVFSNGLVCNGFALTFSGNYSAQLSASELPRRGSIGDDVADQARQLLERLIR